METQSEKKAECSNQTDIRNDVKSGTKRFFIKKGEVTND
jgi:hypothetical protein